MLNYNYARFLPGCLDALLSQTYGDYEIIVIDDCSTDDSLQAVQPYLSDGRVRLIAHERNAGFAASLIEGTEELSRGRFLMVMSADDLALRADAIEKQMAPMLADEGVVLSFSGASRFFSETGEVFDVHRSFDDDVVLDAREAFRRFLTDRRVWAMHSGAICRKSAYDASGGYPRDIATAVDYALWVRIAQEGSVAYCADSLYGYRAHATQMSRSVAAARTTIPECIRIIDDACDRAERRGWDIGTLRRDGMRNQLSSLALHDAFSDRPRLAMIQVWMALRLRPRYLALHKDIWLAAARALLGRYPYDALRSVLRPGRRLSRRLVART
jgi:glycosyltransferase involved in cell wall biosynthesis